MSVRGTVSIEALRKALATADITDLAAAADDAEIIVELEEVYDGSDMSWGDDVEPQHDDFALDDFMSAAIGGDHRTAAAMAARVFTADNLDLVERRLLRARG